MDFGRMTRTLHSISAGEPGLVLRDDRFAIPQDEATLNFCGISVALILRDRRATTIVSKDEGVLTGARQERHELTPC
jgi:hypothetical protein